LTADINPATGPDGRWQSADDEEQSHAGTGFLDDERHNAATRIDAPFLFHILSMHIYIYSAKDFVI
jgi:hypothetical protein